MPPAVAVAAVTAAGALGGAALQSRAAGGATRAQSQATRQAMALERENAAERRRRYDANLARYQEAWDQREAVRRAILAQHGINLPPAAPRAPVAPSGPAGPQAGPNTVAGPETLAGVPNQSNLIQGSQQRNALPPAPPQGGNLSALMGPSAPGPSGAPPPAGGPAQSVPLAPAPAPAGMTLGDLSGWSNWRQYGA